MLIWGISRRKKKVRSRSARYRAAAAAKNRRRVNNMLSRRLSMRRAKGRNAK